MKNITLHKILMWLALFFVGNSLFAQQAVDLTLKFNTTTSEYEVYARPTQNGTFSMGGGSQVSIITPASYPNAKLTVTSVEGGPWDDNSRLYDPIPASAIDFHSISTNGTYPPFSLVANTEKLLFKFTATGGCVPGIRIYRNLQEGALPRDPDSNVAGMQGNDFENYLGQPSTGGVQEYNANYNNTGITCAPAAVPDLITTIGQPLPSLVAGSPSLVPVTVTNIGTGPTTGVITTSITLPTGTSAPAGPFVTNGNTCTTSGQTVTCTNPGPLSITSPTNSTVIEIPVTAAPSTVGTNPGPFTATPSTPGETETVNNPAVPMTPTMPVAPAPAPNVIIALGQPSPNFVAGSPSNVPVTLTNIGTAPETGNINSTITLPAGFSTSASFSPIVGTSCTTSGQVVTCVTAGPLSNTAGSNTAIFNIPVTPAASTVGTTPTTTASVSSPNEPVANQGDNNATPMSPTTPVAAAPAPDLVTTIGQPSPSLVAGSPSIVPVTVTNIGTSPTTGVITTSITLPTGTSAPAGPFVTNGNTCTTSGQTVTCTNPGPLSITNPTNSTVIEIPVTAAPSTVGTNPGPFTATPSTPDETVTANNPAAPMTPTMPVAAAPAPDLVTTIGQPSPSLVAGSPSIVPVTVTNIGTSPTTGVITTSITLPTGTSAPASPFVTNGNTCTTSGQVVTCTNPGPLSITSPTNSTVIEIPVTAAPSTVGTNPGPFTATPSTPGETTTANNPAAPMTPTTPVTAAPAPDLVTMIGQPATPFVAGTPSSVPVTVTNIGTAPATGPINTTITLPTGFSAPATFPAPAGTTCSTSGQIVTCVTAGPLSQTAPNNTIAISVPVTPAASTVGTTPTTTATTSAPNEPVSNTTNNNATPMSPTTPVAGGPDLVTTIGAVTPALVVGTTSQLPVTVTNIGTAPTNGSITTTITLPTGITTDPIFVSNGFTCSTSGQTVTCFSNTVLSNVSPNNATTILIPVNAMASTIGTTPVFNATTGGGGEPAANTGNNAAPPTGAGAPVQATPAPNLTLAIGQPSPSFVVGMPSNVPVTISNIGTASATGTINTTITLPTGMSAPATFVTPAGTTCTTSGQTVSCTSAGPLSQTAPNNTIVFNIPVTAAASTVGTAPTFNGNTSVASEPVANTGNNTASMTPSSLVVAAPAPDLVTTIGQPSPSLVAGTPSTVPVTVTNIGTSPTTGVITTIITLPIGTSTLPTFTSNGNTCNTVGQTVTCTNPGPLSNLAPNNSTVINVPVTAAPSTVGTNPGPFAATPSTPGETVTANNPAAPMTPTNPVVAAPIVSVKLNVKVFLQGAYDNATGLMRDDLRTRGLLPVAQPYSALPRTAYHSGTETASSPVFATTGSNAIVDWVLVELRTGTSAATRVATRAALVQRDGDVVDIDGTSPLTFANQAAGNYYIAVTHRNHLGAMTEVAITTSATPASVDFTGAYDGYGNNAMKSIGNLNALWAGNANLSGVTHRNVIFSGANNDSDGVKNDILTHASNGAQNYSFVPSGYYLGDTNLDGDVKYQGLANDVDALIFFNVIDHPTNSTDNPLFIISEQH